MGENILEDGKMVSRMERVLLLLQQGKKRKENGRMDKEKDGLFLKKKKIKNKSKLKQDLKIYLNKLLFNFLKNKVTKILLLITKKNIQLKAISSTNLIKQRKAVLLMI